MVEDMAKIRPVPKPVKNFKQAFSNQRKFF